MSKFSKEILNSNDLFIVGSTASGKSSLSLELAESLKCSIVNCDSLQFFKSLKIGTAYPTDEDLSRIEHLLFGIAEAGSFFSAGEFVREFEKLRSNPQRKKQSFLITGGSGFYIKALETGMADVQSLTPEMKHKISFLEDLNDIEKSELLNQIDPIAYDYIHFNDNYRIHRALEIYYSEGLKFSDLKKNKPKNMHLKTSMSSASHSKLGLYLEKSELLLRVQKRTQKMLDTGLLDEVKLHLDMGLQDWKPLQSVGYKESQMYLNGQIKLSELKDQIVINTMYLAKRQMTWFRADPKVAWFHAEKELNKAKLWAQDHHWVPGSALRS